MKLDKISFERMEQGFKTCDLRLMDDKRKLFQLGDQISFKLFPKLEHSCLMEITGLLHYPDFTQLLNDIDLSWLGHEEKDRDWVEKTMYEIYSKEDEQENGVLGIRLRKVIAE